MAGIEMEKLMELNTLVFSSLEFLFRYLPLFLLLFFAVPDRFKLFVLFSGSIVLYALGDPQYVFLLLGMALVNYLFGRTVGKGAKMWMAAAVACNVGLLVYFKLSNAFDASFLLPVGISFYTFKSLSYLADVYRKKIPEERSFLRLAAYLCMFPQIVSGPIMRYEDALKGMTCETYRLTRVEDGLKYLVAGLAAKVLIADRLGILWNDVQTVGFESISTPLAWLGMAAYSLQLYFDFAGYSLMAVGIGQMIGFPVIENFHYPYASRSVSEFYRRWHMTLGSWFKDYVYIPLGGSRKGTKRTVLNLLAVWLLTGFWHGNGIHFLVWGLCLGLLIVAEKLWLGRFLAEHRILSHLYVLLVIPLTWILFAVESLPQAGLYFTRLFPFFGTGETVYAGDFLKELTIFAPTLAAAVLFCIPAVGIWCEKHRRNTVVMLLLAAVFWIAVYRMANAANNPFMYANF